MPMRSALVAIAAVIVSATSVVALESSMTAPSPLSPDALWKKVGDFCGIPRWNPAVEKCVLSADGKERTVSIFGIFATTVARLDHWDDANRSYTLTNVSGLLPVANYHATISVIENANGSVLKMTATYDAKGAPDVDAKKAVDAVLFGSLCLNSPVLCFADPSVAPAELVQFEGAPVSPTRLILQAYLRRPLGAGPFPAVVLLHGCSGSPEPIDQDWGIKLASWGYVTLTIDSFGPRGLKNTCGQDRPFDIFFDAYRGLNFLVEKQFVDPKRVAALGFSQGGWIALSSVESGAIEQASENKFRAAAAIYPLCSPIKGPMTVPTLIMIGESDDWTTADACRKLAAGQDDLGISRPKSAGSAIQLNVYPGAYHGYDLAYLQTPVTFFGHRLEFNKSATDQSTDALREFLRSMGTERP